MKVQKATGPEGLSSSRSLRSRTDQLCSIVEYIWITQGWTTTFSAFLLHKQTTICDSNMILMISSAHCHT